MGSKEHLVMPKTEIACATEYSETLYTKEDETPVHVPDSGAAPTPFKIPTDKRVKETPIQIPETEYSLKTQMNTCAENRKRKADTGINELSNKEKRRGHTPVIAEKVPVKEDVSKTVPQDIQNSESLQESRERRKSTKVSESIMIEASSSKSNIKSVHSSQKSASKSVQLDTPEVNSNRNLASLTKRDRNIGQSDKDHDGKFIL